MKINLKDISLKCIGSNKTVLQTDKIDILFSYESPVAARTYRHAYINREFYKFSRTTTRHIDEWLGGLSNEAIIYDKDEWAQLLTAPENY